MALLNFTHSNKFTRANANICIINYQRRNRDSQKRECLIISFFIACCYVCDFSLTPHALCSLSLFAILIGIGNSLWQRHLAFSLLLLSSIQHYFRSLWFITSTPSSHRKYRENVNHIIVFWRIFILEFILERTSKCFDFLLMQ